MQAANKNRGHEKRRNLPERRRREAAERPKYKTANLPLATEHLKKLGLHHWCSESEPERDCTNNPRITRSNCRFRANDEMHNRRMSVQRRALQAIAWEMWEHYPSLRMIDIAHLMGYHGSDIVRFIDWVPPKGR